MVPARLALRNFLCYRGECPPLDFQHVRVACLTGENGNGKSALLDAITWALWGRARGKSDGDLVSLGQSEMEVELEFFVGEARYRVLRKYRRQSAAGAGRTTLEFQAWSGETWRVLSGSTQTETQRAILDVLKLNYETFVNSAFLLQGRADSFTTKTPGDRKQVLAEILSLDQYDLFEERAKERRNQRDRTAKLLETRIHDDEQQLARLPGLRAERNEAVAELEETESGLKREEERRDRFKGMVEAAQRARHDLEAARALLAAADRDLGAAEVRVRERLAQIELDERVVADAPSIAEGYARLTEACAALRTATVAEEAAVRALVDARRMQSEAAAELAAATTRLEQRRAGIKRDEALVKDASAVRAGFRELERAREREQALNATLREVRLLEREREQTQQAIARAEAEVNGQLRVATAAVVQLTAQAARLDELHALRARSQAAQAEVEAAERHLLALREEEADLRASALALQAENARLRDEMGRLAKKRDELKAAEAEGAMSCPLCRSELGAHGLHQIEQAYETEGSQLAAAFRANKARITELEASAQGKSRAATDLDADLVRRRNDWQQRFGALPHQIQEAEAASARLAVARAEVGRLEHALASGAAGGQQRTHLVSVEQALAALAYDEATHEVVRGRVVTLAPFQQQHEALVPAEARLVAARSELAMDESVHERCRRRHDEASERVAALERHLGELSAAVVQQRADAERLAAFEERKRLLDEAERRLFANREALASDERVLETQRQARARAAAEVGSLEKRVAETPDVSAQLQQAEEAVALLRARADGLRRAIGGFDQEIDTLEETERATAERRRRLERAQHERGIYEELVLAFGKRGIQALIIESALPEIEAVANDLLARMTNNRMHVTLESQRQNLKGTVQETLDIRIADEWGTRSYEMFSGGEAFRINLALRIALSKLLARRAGAPLPTLVIDEGFGTQDAAGRERLIEALNAIQQDFQCLLLVTHIEELRDLFDTRIEVRKSGDGSIATIVAA